MSREIADSENGAALACKRMLMHVGIAAAIIFVSIIGTQDLGSETNRTRTGNKTGRAPVAGLCIAFLGIIADRIIGAWIRRRKEKLGLS